MQDAPVKKAEEVKKTSSSSQPAPETGRLSQQTASKRATGSRSESNAAEQREDEDRVETSPEAEKEGAPGVLKGLTSWVGEATNERSQAIEKQHQTRWQDRGDVRRNLARNGDLSTYSKEQLLALDSLARRDPKLGETVRERTADFVGQADSLDELPDNLGFQVLLKNQILDRQQDRCLIQDPTAKARQHVDQLVDQHVREKLDARLEGQEGDEAAESAAGKWASDIRASMDRHPALSSRLESRATALSEDEATSERLQEIAQADDSFLTKAIRDTGNFLSDRLGEALKLPTPLNPIGALTTTSKLLDAAGWEDGANFARDVQGGAINAGQGMVTGMAASLTDPLATAQGMFELGSRGAALANPALLAAQGAATGKSPLEQAGENLDFFKKTGEAAVQTYRETGEEHGLAGALTHGAVDVAVMATTGGSGAAALKSATLGRASEAAVNALRRPIPEAPRSVQELMELKASMKDLPAPYKQLKSTSVSGAESSLEFNPDALLDEVSERVDRGELLPRELRMLLAQG